MEGFGGAGVCARMPLLGDDLPDAQQVAIEVDHGKLSKAPRLVFQGIHTWDTCARQLTGREGAEDFLYVQDTDVAACG